MFRLRWLLLCSWVNEAVCKDILILPCAGLTHRRSILPYAISLAERGHQITIWSPDLNQSALTNLPTGLTDFVYVIDSKDRFLLDVVKYENDTTTSKMLWQMSGYSHVGMVFFWKTLAGVTETLLTEHRSELDRLASQHWDLVIVDALFTPWANLIVQLTSAPYVLWATTVDVGTWPVPFSSISTYPSIAASESANLLGRVQNTIDLALNYVSYMLIEYLISPALKPVINDFNFKELEDNCVMRTSQFPILLDWPIANTLDNRNLPTVCPKPSQLSLNFLDFVDVETSEGTTIVAFGHQIKWSSASDTQLGSFVIALSQLSQYRIIWQCDINVDSFNPPLPSHILVTKWLPQVDLLHHPKTKLFVTHGGLKSLLESVCAGQPVVIMPQMAEQSRNAAVVQRLHIGVAIDKVSMNPSLVFDAIQSVLSDSTYTLSAQRLRRMILDTPIPSADFSSFMFERLLKQNGIKSGPYEDAPQNRQVYFHLLFAGVIAGIIHALVITSMFV